MVQPPHLRSPLGPGALQWNVEGVPIPGWGMTKKKRMRKAMSAGRQRSCQNHQRPQESQHEAKGVPPCITTPSSQREQRLERTQKRSVRPMSAKPSVTWNGRHSKCSSTLHQGALGGTMARDEVAPVVPSGAHVSELPSRIKAPRRPQSASVTSLRSHQGSTSSTAKMKLRKPPQHLPPHLKTQIKGVLCPCGDFENDKRWKSSAASLLRAGIYNNDGKLMHKSQQEKLMEFPNRYKMIPGTMTHFVQAAIMQQVDIYADGHGDYKHDR